MKKEDIKEALKETMHEVLTQYGFTMADPNAMQADLLHLRNLRLGCEATRRNILKAIIGVTVPAALYIVWGWLRGHFKGASI